MENQKVSEGGCCWLKTASFSQPSSGSTIKIKKCNQDMTSKNTESTDLQIHRTHFDYNDHKFDF